ncbi:2,3-bisphosphoglycerate-independent phosphoglycerate mutase [Patescibacteria group bacterium]
MATGKRKLVVLVILDGWGIAPPGPGNAIALAKTPQFDRLWTVYPHTQLQASGEAVGLPPSEDGNSETGHLNIGAGNIVYQDLPRINMAIAEGTFFNNPAFLKAIDHVQRNQSKLHLMGLISDAGVHSSLNHLFALLRLAKDHNLPEVYLHLFTDGRDSSPTSSMVYIKNIQEKIKEIGVGQIASLIGRYFAMDRDHRWDRTQKAYDLLVSGLGKKTNSEERAIAASYQDGITDEFVEPILLVKEDGQPRALIEDDDAVIFFNYRVDRPRQITKAFVLPEFEQLEIKKAAFDPYAERYGKKQYEVPGETTTFVRQKILKNLCFVSMTQYEKDLPTQVAFAPVLVKMPLARLLSEYNIQQAHIAETEKFPHVTYFFNGGREKPFPGENQLKIASPKVATYDLQPAMSASEVTKQVIKMIQSLTYQFIIVNYANPDMVAHTGVLEAAVEACQITDHYLGEIVKKTISFGGTAIVTADHGNVEEMINLQTGEVDTEHSTNLVPFIVANENLGRGGKSLRQGILADVAPTILGLLDINVPSMMSGRDLLKTY